MRLGVHRIRIMFKNILRATGGVSKTRRVSTTCKKMVSLCSLRDPEGVGIRLACTIGVGVGIEQAIASLAPCIMSVTSRCPSLAYMNSRFFQSRFHTLVERYHNMDPAPSTSRSLFVFMWPQDKLWFMDNMAHWVFDIDMEYSLYKGS